MQDSGRPDNFPDGIGLEGMARYPGQLIAPAECFGLQPRLVWPLGLSNCPPLPKFDRSTISNSLTKSHQHYGQKKNNLASVVWHQRFSNEFFNFLLRHK